MAKAKISKYFTIETVQVSLFPKEFVLRGPEILKFTSNSVDELPFFDGASQPLPIPDDAPFDIPRIFLKSKDNRYECQISLNKIGFVIRNIAGEYDNNEMYEDIVEKAEMLVEYLVSKSVSINRIGNIITGMVEVEGGTSAEYLVEKYGNEKELLAPQEFSIRYITQKNEVSGFKSNTVLMLGQVGSGNRLNKDNEHVVTVAVDVNTAPELMEESEFKKSEVNTYIREGFTQAAQIVSDYGFIKS